MPITKAPDKINKTPQEMQNLSFDTDFNVNAVEVLNYKSSTNTMERAEISSEVTLADVVHMLAHIAKLLEPVATRDTSNRQRVYVEGIEGTSLGNAITTAFSNEAGSSGICQPSTTTRYYQHVFTGPVDQRFFMMDQARGTYANSIRANLSFN